jgi:DTW domain-containing protein
VHQEVIPIRLEPPADAPPAGRRLCYRCFRPEGLCLCASIPRIANRTPVLIVQHPRERAHPFNTARLGELGLERLRVVVDYDSRLRKHPETLELPRGAGLLYPHPCARDIHTLTPEERPESLVVIDGTWHHARTLYRDIPRLHALPHFTLPAHHTSSFQIRRQPQAHCLSTVEAIVLALQALEPETVGLELLLAAFRRMVEDQLHVAGRVGRRRNERRARVSRAIPRALVENFGSLVVAYGESVPDLEAPGERRLISLAAERPATGERLYCLLKTPKATAAHLGHMGLSPEAVAAGLSAREFAGAWARFMRPGDVLGAWNQSTLDLLRSLSAEPAPVVFTGASRRGPTPVLLKAAYCNVQRYRGSLDDIVQAERLSLPQAPGTVRAHTRLANAVALAKLLHHIGTQDVGVVDVASGG